MNLDYTNQGRRPTVAQIMSDWRKGGSPQEFTVEYGETFARFQYAPCWGNDWQADGNGCRGVDRDKVLAKLNEASAKRRAATMGQGEW